MNEGKELEDADNQPLLESEQEEDVFAPVTWWKRLKRKYPTVGKLLYPNRPFVTLMITPIIIGLGVFGFLPFSLAMFLGIYFLTDDVIITPILQLIKYVRNFQLKRKLLKSIVGVTLILMAYVVGALLGFFLLSHIGVLLSVAPMFSSVIHTSITQFTIMAVCAITLSQALRLHPFLTLSIGCAILFFAPIPIFFPPVVDIAVGTALVATFFTTLLQKHLFRLANWLVTGHSNSDGYYGDGFKDELIEKDRSQAEKFGVTPEQFRAFRVSTVHMIEQTKRLSPLFTGYTGSRHKELNALKNIYHRSMSETGEDTKENVKSLGEIIHTFDLTKEDTYPNRFKPDFHPEIAKEVYGEGFGVLKALASLRGYFGVFACSRTGMQLKDGWHKKELWWCAIKCHTGDEASQQALSDFNQAVKVFKPRTSS